MSTTLRSLVELRKKPSTQETCSLPPSFTYAIINNIPKEYRSSNLRDFFSQLVETNCFKCFHFRHRPEVKVSKKVEENQQPSSSQSQSRCCVVIVKRDNLKKLIDGYHRKHWLNSKGGPSTQRCFISEIEVTNGNDDANKTSDREILTNDDIQTLAELHPPAVMPNGNVGTPTAVFLDLIRECRLPSSVIGKLGLRFPKTKPAGKFSTVPLAYEGSTVTREANSAAKASADEEASADESTSGETGPSTSGSTAAPGSVRDVRVDGVETEEERRSTERDGESPEDDASDDDGCEEWERHEALHQDEFDRSRTKERLYEEKIELKWEKGGSGLVFYTDTYRWKQDEGDFDEQTVDDWDVDMSGYYDDDPEAGDKDARDFISMRKGERRRRGSPVPDDDVFSGKIGKFEAHTKGFGRKLMEKQGWRDGRGLGPRQKGMSDALHNEGQPSHVKTGFGYRGEKLNRHPLKRPGPDVVISTVYDKPSDLEKPDTLYRRHGETNTNMTYKAASYGRSKGKKPIIKSSARTVKDA